MMNTRDLVKIVGGAASIGATAYMVNDYVTQDAIDSVVGFASYGADVVKNYISDLPAPVQFAGAYAVHCLFPRNFWAAARYDSWQIKK